MKRRTKFTCHLWLVICHFSLVTCHMSLFKHFSILLESQGIRKYRTWYVTKILLHVTCHLSLVTCHLSHVYTKMYSWNHKEFRRYWYVEVWKPILCCQAKWGTSSRGEVHSGPLPALPALTDDAGGRCTGGPAASRLNKPQVGQAGHPSLLPQ